jgi:hypothetical protein
MKSPNKADATALAGGRPYRVVIGVQPELYRLFAQPQGLAEAAAEQHDFILKVPTVDLF